MKFYPIDIKAADWKRLDRFADRTVFQTREWLQFIAESQNAQPVLAELRESSEVLGYFTGLTFSKFGMKVWAVLFPAGRLLISALISILASRGAPRSGPRKVCVGRSPVPASGSLRSELHFRRRRGGGIQNRILRFVSLRPVPLGRGLVNGMESACRRCIRKADKSGLKIEEAHDLAFADEYYEQLQDVLPSSPSVPRIPRTASAPWFATSSPAQCLDDSSAQSGREVHRHRDLPRLQPDCRVLGQRQLPCLSEPAPERSLPLVRHALLEKTRGHHLRLGRRRHLQGKYGCTPHRVPWLPSLAIRS